MLNELKSAQSASYYFCSMVLTPRTLEVAKCNILQLELTALVQKDQYRDLRQPGTIAKRWDDYTVYKRVDRAISTMRPRMRGVFLAHLLPAAPSIVPFLLILGRAF